MDCVLPAGIACRLATAVLRSGQPAVSPTITTTTSTSQRILTESASGHWVMPGIAFRQQLVGLGGPPATARIRLDWYCVAEHWLNDAPGSLHGVLPGKQVPLAAQCGPDE